MLVQKCGKNDETDAKSSWPANTPYSLCTLERRQYYLRQLLVFDFITYLDSQIYSRQSATSIRETQIVNGEFAHPNITDFVDEFESNRGLPQMTDKIKKCKIGTNEKKRNSVQKRAQGRLLSAQIVN